MTYGKEERFSSPMFPKMSVDINELQKIQDVYAQLTSLFMFCVDSSGQRITEMSGNPVDMNRILALIDEDKIVSVIQRVLESSVEDQVVEDTSYSNVKIASIAIRINNKLAFCWFVCAVLESDDEENAILNMKTVTNHVRFMKSLELLREMSKKVYANDYIIQNAVAETKRSRNSELEMIHSLNRSESMTKVVQLLDSDDKFETISRELLFHTCEYARISYGFVIRPNVNGVDVDMLGVYTAPNQNSLEETIRNMGQPALLSMGDKPSVISYKTNIDAEDREWMDDMGISAMVILPIYTNRSLSMYLIFADNTMNKEWDLDEIKFFGDAQRILTSILSRRIQRNSLASSYKSLEAILDNVGSAIYVRDVASGEILFTNKIFQNRFEFEMKTGKIDELFGTAISNHTGEEGESSQCEVHYGERGQWYDVKVTHIYWVDGRLAALCAIVDITEKKQYQQKIEQQANNDFLTGLYNRMCCERDLERFIAEARATNRKGALLYLDLDDFKHINDGLGHQYGDVLLQAISHSLQRIQGVENSCYRMGGDEFIVIIPCENFDRFEAIIEEINVVFNKPWFLKGADYYCTTSMGVVTFPEDGETGQDVIQKADIAMYEAKKSGKNRTSYYTENAGAESNKRLDMEKHMRDATVDYKEFEIYYQPIIDVTRPGTPCTGAEALIRWNSHDLGYVLPGEFIPLAEYLGLINPIGGYVLNQACLACKKWNEMGHPYYKVNVNLSVVQLLQNDIVESIETTIKETGINPRNLTLEVTESLAINDMKRMKKILGDIKKLGVRIALDDFGTGYSSLSHIREIPLDVIKVDQSFVTELATDQYAQAFVKMVGELASALGVKICVEGIETQEQYKVLENMNVKMVQGYYFDRPMKQEAFEQKYVNGAFE